MREKIGEIDACFMRENTRLWRSSDGGNMGRLSHFKSTLTYCNILWRTRVQTLNPLIKINKRMRSGKNEKVICA